MQPNFLDMPKRIQLKHLKYEAINEATGLGIPYLSRIFNGSQRISEATIERFANLLGCSLVEAYRQIEEVRKIKQTRKNR
jgi:transcriptional regulator with XRE-family HTH domain